MKSRWQLLFEAVSKRKTIEQQQDLKVRRYERYTEALLEAGFRLPALIDPFRRERDKARWSQIVPEEEAQDFFHWLTFRKLEKTEVGWSISSTLDDLSAEARFDNALDDEGLWGDEGGYKYDFWSR